MSQDEVDFLKDQVQRLNHQLAKYRGQHVDHDDADEDYQERPDATWLTNKSVLSPLLAEYDNQLSEYRQLVDDYQAELNALKPEVSRIVHENERLSEKLKESVTSQIPGGAIENVEPLQGDDQVLQNLQMQVDIVLQEKETAVERWQEAEQEIDRLQRVIQNEKNSHQWGVIEQQAQHMQSEFFETVNLLNKELEQCHQELRESKQELETVTHQVKDLRKTNKELEAQLSWKDQEVAEVIFKEGITDSKVAELKRIMDDRKRKITVLETELEEIKRDKQSLEVRITEMQKRSTDVGNCEMEAVTQMREAVQMVETAALEKEQAEIDLHQKEEEIEQLREVINKLIDDAGVRTRQQVDSVRNQCNEHIKKLTEEVHALEMDNAEKVDSLEKAMREKRAAESELEKVYKEGASQRTKEMDSYEVMNKRAINAERARDDAIIQVENLQHRLKREEMNTQQLKAQLEGQLDNYRERMSQLQNEFESTNDDRIRMSDEVDDMKKRLQAAEREKEAAQRKYNKEITIFEQENSMKLREFEVKLQSTEDVNRNTTTQLRKLLTSQQRMSARWKEECTSIAQKYEAKITDLRTEMALLKKRNKEVTNLLKDSQEKTIQAEKMIQEYTRGIQRMESRMRESENRAADASKELSRHRIREKQMESERRSLSNELRRSQIQEAQRSHLEASTKSHRSEPEELLIGDLAGSRGSLGGSTRRKGEIDNVLDNR